MDFIITLLLDTFFFSSNKVLKVFPFFYETFLVFYLFFGQKPGVHQVHFLLFRQEVVRSLI